MRIARMLRQPLFLLLIACGINAMAEDGIALPSKGQTVYVPVYSAIQHGNLDASGKAESDLMSVLVSVRNTDPGEGIRILSAPYYDTNGKLIRDYLSKPRVVPPLGTVELFVERRETQGGSGANFLVRWESEKPEKPVNPPIIEALHTRFQAGRTLGFISRGKAISAP
jgi:hypothetical protein